MESLFSISDDNNWYVLCFLIGVDNMSKLSKWNKVLFDTNDEAKTLGCLPVIDMQCLVIRKNYNYIETMSWNSTELCWDDESGDDFLCDIYEVEYWQPFPEMPKNG
jgi:hypothetical protein